MEFCSLLSTLSCWVGAVLISSWVLVQTKLGKPPAAQKVSQVLPEGKEQSLSSGCWQRKILLWFGVLMRVQPHITWCVWCLCVTDCFASLNQCFWRALTCAAATAAVYLSQCCCAHPLCGCRALGHFLENQEKHSWVVLFSVYFSIKGSHTDPLFLHWKWIDIPGSQLEKPEEK